MKWMVKMDYEEAKTMKEWFELSSVTVNKTSNVEAIKKELAR